MEYSFSNSKKRNHDLELLCICLFERDRGNILYYKTSLKELWCSMCNSSANQVGVVTYWSYSLLVVAHFLLLEKHGGVELFVGTSMIEILFIYNCRWWIIYLPRKKTVMDWQTYVCAYPIRSCRWSDSTGGLNSS